MAEYTINKIVLPNGDSCNLLSAGSAPSIHTSVTAWSNIYTALTSVLTLYNSALIYVTNVETAKLLSGDVITSLFQGVVTRVTDGVYEFDVHKVNSGDKYMWRISGLTSATATPTIGTIYQHLESYRTQSMYMSSSDVLTLWQQLTRALPEIHHGIDFMSTAPATNVLTNTKVNALISGTVFRSTDTKFDFIGHGLANAYMYKWRAEFDSTHTSLTVSTVYRFTGTAM